MEKVDITIIGAGVIGLGLARKLARSFDNILVIERNKSFGQETSSRNSEVIHAGIYYAEGSLKARTCVRGGELLYKLCAEQNIPHKRIGKLIVATAPEEIDMLKKLRARGEANGVEGLSIIEKKDIKKFEPHVEALAAIRSAQTGIIDSHSFMKYLETSAKSRGADTAYGVELVSIEYKKPLFEITVADRDKKNFSFETRVLINCAGLGSDRIAEMAGIDTAKNKYELYYCKGDYFRIAGEKRKLINGLVYPVPRHHAHGLGIHVTPDLSGGVRLGPDHEYITRTGISYDVNIGKKRLFSESVRKFLTFIHESDIGPDTAGIRPRLYKEDEPERDFIIKEESDNGLPGLINLIGIESPGLTGSLAIAELVEKMVKKL